MLAIQDLAIVGNFDRVAIEPPFAVNDLVRDPLDVGVAQGPIECVALKQVHCHFWGDGDDLGRERFIEH